jgi:hypothetical protein
MRKRPKKKRLYHFPVASTFTPSKGKAEGEKRKTSDFV